MSGEIYLNMIKKEFLRVKEKIDKTDKEIDKMVYKLYGLSDDEVEIIEKI